MFMLIYTLHILVSENFSTSLTNNQAPLSLSSGYVLQSWCIISTRFQTL